MNGKLYVGSSVDIRMRFGQHKHHLRSGTHRNRYLQNAWNKYGEQSFIFEIVKLCTKDERLELETQHIKALKAHNRRFGYNSAYPVRQLLPSPEMSKVAKASWKDTKTGHNRRQGIRSKWNDVEFRKAKAKDFEKGRQAALSRWEDPAFRAQQSAIRSAQWEDPDWRAAREAELKIKTAKAHTPEAKAKRKISLKEMWADPEFKAKHMDRLRINAIAMTKARMAKKAAKSISNEIV